MKEEEIKKRNLKLTVFDSFSYKRIREVCDTICGLDFECEFVDNGNIVFMDIKEPTNTSSTKGESK